jgi:hypothetical protein
MTGPLATSISPQAELSESLVASGLTENDLHAYADGQLPPERVAEMESALRRDPALAERVAQIRAQNAALHVSRVRDDFPLASK